jgi:Pentapeptide repeats (8 copies)
MSDLNPAGKESVERWLAHNHELFVTALHEIFDIEAGLRDALLPTAHTALVADIAATLDIQGGLADVLQDDSAPRPRPAATQAKTDSPPVVTADSALPDENTTAGTVSGAVPPAVTQAEPTIPALPPMPTAVADFSDSDQTGASFAKQSLVGANFTNAELGSADFTQADLRRARLHDANLANAKLDKADLSHADLQHANLLRASLIQANLRAADLTKANMAGADLRQADLRNARTTAEDLQGAKWDESTQWSPDILKELKESSVEVAPATEAAPAIYEVTSRPEEAGAAARRRR